MKRYILSVSAISLVALLPGCGLNQSAVKQELNVESANWQSAGSISLFRPVPIFTGDVEATSLLGFAPAPSIHLGSWLKINKGSETISLYDGNRQVISAKMATANLIPGQYTMMHKQQDPTWYAPDSYFSARGLDIPSEGEASRYLRGALGPYALFLSPETPLHCGPIDTTEIGGAKISEEPLAELYASVAVGTPVVVE